MRKVRLLNIIRTSQITCVLFALVFVVLEAVLLNTSHAPAATDDNKAQAMIGAGAQQSENWAGYVAATSLSLPQKDSVSDVKGNWTVPAVTGTSDAYSSTWVGIDGFSDNTVEQVGVSQNWINGAAQYYAWYEMYPNAAVFISSVPVSPGDCLAEREHHDGFAFGGG